MNEETLGMVIGFLIVAPISAYVVYKLIKKRAPEARARTTDKLP